MRTVPVLAGIAALAVAGFSLSALAQDVHTMTVHLPGGGTEHILYTGDHAPRIVINRGAQNPFVQRYSSWYSPFAALDRISAEMNRQMDEMMRETATMPLLAAPSRLIETHNTDAGATSFSMVSTMSGGHVCMQSVQITTDASGKRHVEQHSSGDCQGAHMQGPADISAAPLHPQKNGTIEVKSDSPFRYSSGFVGTANYRTDN